MSLPIPLSSSPRDEPERGPGIEPGRPALHPLELTLVACTTLHLCFLPWALGTMHPWSQLASLGFGLAGFLVAALPRFTTRGLSSEPPAVEWPASRLPGFPIFWAGLTLLGYIALQGSNPAWRFVSDDTSWLLEPATPITWLPSGVDAPFDRSNPWRTFVVAASCWLLVCSIWMGFRRRRSFQILLTTLAVNAVLLALLGLLQKLSGAKRIFWSYLPSNESFAASFIYPNHASPYFNLMAALTVGLAWRHYHRARRGVETTGRARILTLCSILIGVGVIFSYSRMAILLLLAFAAVMVALLAYRWFARKNFPSEHPEFLPLALALAVVLGVGLGSLRAGKLWARFAPMVADPAATAYSRTVTRQAATNMLQSRWLFGWGAGCFRHGFPLFTQNYPAIYDNTGNHGHYWEHAHNDLLEIPLEIGVVGALPLAWILGWGMWRLIRRRFWRNPVSLTTIFGCGLVLLHAWVDFVFQNPAVLLTWSVLFVGMIRWTELDSAGPIESTRFAGK